LPFKIAYNRNGNQSNSAMSSPRGGYQNSTNSSSSSSSSSHSCSGYANSAYATPTTGNGPTANVLPNVFGNTVPSPGFLNGAMSNLMSSAFSSVGHFGLGVAK
jgi:hypothetical protein